MALPRELLDLYFFPEHWQIKEVTEVSETRKDITQRHTCKGSRFRQ